MYVYTYMYIHICFPIRVLLHVKVPGPGLARAGDDTAGEFLEAHPRAHGVAACQLFGICQHVVSTCYILLCYANDILYVICMAIRDREHSIRFGILSSYIPLKLK